MYVQSTGALHCKKPFMYFKPSVRLLITGGKESCKVTLWINISTVDCGLVHECNVHFIRNTEVRCVSKSCLYLNLPVRWYKYWRYNLQGRVVLRAVRFAMQKKGGWEIQTQGHNIVG